MKVVILAGGFGTRISEESHLKPKPMIEIGEMPIIWHIMKTYSHYGFHEFIICCGYKGYLIKEYFRNYFLYRSDITFDFSDGNKLEIHSNNMEPWKVTLVDTGLNTMTGGRIKQIQKYIEPGEPFMLTYGDGVSDINITELLQFHKEKNKIATLTAINPSGKYGVLDIADDGVIQSFEEKPNNTMGWINGGYFVLNYEVFNYIQDDISTIFERGPIENLVEDNELTAYKHEGFWQCMDTMRDRLVLEELWNKNEAPWKVWN